MSKICMTDTSPESHITDNPIFVLAILAFACCLIYLNTLSSPFILDDDIFILNDRNIRVTELTVDGLTNAAVLGQPRHRLLPNLSWAVNYYFGRYDVTGYHVVNIAIHLISGIILFFFFQTTLALAPYRPDIHSHPMIVPFFAAMLWLVHPISTQSVTYVCQRMTSMAALFYILSLFLYVKARIAQRSNPARHLTPMLLFTGCLASGLAAVASKENAAMLPIFILLYEWFFFQDLKISWSAKKTIWIFGVIIVFSIIGLSYLGDNPLARIASAYVHRDFTLHQRVMTEWRVVVYYISLFFFPAPSRLNLEHDYPLSYSPVDPWSTLFSLSAIFGLILLSIYTTRKYRLFSFCMIWFLGNLIIESSVIGIEIIFEHRTYLPFMMISLMAVALCQNVIRSRKTFVGLMCAAVAFFCVWTYQRNGVWQNEITFYQDCAAKSPGKFRPHNNLGIALYNVGQFQNAIGQYQAAIKIDPNHKNIASTLNNLGNAWLKLDRVDEAISFFKQALERNPAFASAQINLGTALIRKNRLTEAMDHFSTVIKHDPDNVEAHINMGLALARSDRIDEAIAHYETALRIFPYHPETYNNLGVLLVRKNRITDARHCFLKAIELKPDYASPKSNLSRLKMMQQP